MFTTVMPKTKQKMSLIGFSSMQRYPVKDHSYFEEFIDKINDTGTDGESGTKNEQCEQCNHGKC